MDKVDYKSKMLAILDDQQRFEVIEADLYKTVLKYEDKANRLVDALFKKNLIGGPMKYRLRCSGSKPGVMYGLPKLHKRQVPLRPILSTIGSYNYELSRYLVELLLPLSKDVPYSVCDSFSFAREITSFKNSDFIMCSFDVVSLFTVIPIPETCEIILKKLFPVCGSYYKGYDRATFKKTFRYLCQRQHIFI